MDPLPPPLAFFLLLVSGWVNRHQQDVIDYLREENRVLRAVLVVRMARENPTWGYTRILGGLKGLGHDVARNTIKAILKDHGIAPVPERGMKTPWKTFLAARWDALAAADFFTVEVLTLGGLVRYSVFFVMKLKTRTVEIAGITCQPHEQWMTQVARNLTDAGDGFLRGVQHVILDRDPLYSAAFRRLLRDSGVKAIASRGLTQAKAATILRVTQPRVSDVLRGRIDLFSTDSLIDMLARLGLHVRFVLKSSRRGQKVA